jgi:hypothetical protein
MNLQEIKKKWEDIQKYLPIKASGRNNKVMEVIKEIPYLIKEIEDKELTIKTLKERLREQTHATQEAHEFVDDEIRKSCEHHGVKLGDKSCPIWQRIMQVIIDFKNKIK